MIDLQSGRPNLTQWTVVSVPGEYRCVRQYVSYVAERALWNRPTKNTGKENYEIISCIRVLADKTINPSARQIPRLLCNRKFHHLYTTAPPPRVPFLSQIDPVHTTHLMSSRSVLILSSHLNPCIPSVLFPSGFPIKTSPLNHMCHIPRPSLSCSFGATNYVALWNTKISVLGTTNLVWNFYTFGLKIFSIWNQNWKKRVFLPVKVPVCSGVPRGSLGGSKPPPPPKFRSFDKVEPDCKLSGKCLVFLFQHPN